MKKITISLIVSIFILSNDANASNRLPFHNILSNANNRLPFYIGLEAQSHKLDYRNSDVIDNDNKANSFPGLYIGYIIPNLNIEISYSRIGTYKVNKNSGLYVTGTGAEISTRSKVYIDNIGVDLKPNISFDSLFFPKINIYAILGLNVLSSSIEENYDASNYHLNIKENEDSLGYSVGGGLEYFLLKNAVSARIQAKYSWLNLKYQKTQGIKSINNLTTCEAGISFYFY